MKARAGAGSVWSVSYTHLDVYKRQALVKLFQDLTALVDSSDICLFTTFAIGLPEVSAMLRGTTGFEYTDEEMLRAGERIWNLEKLFNLSLIHI